MNTDVTSIAPAARVAFATSLPCDDHGRYAPAPGTEYPFSVSDIGRATVQILGPDWHAESTPWGVAATVEHQGAPSVAYRLDVDRDGDLYVSVSADWGDESRVYLSDACSVDGLPALAHRVADALRSLGDAD
ncbi:hypothetical protein [Streptomyces sp. NPDC020965]|uniref:hypothetical protein n=1 Tax=Streptomyces sp. NPDC020965 TaxID=3365105 RepID=UPI00379FB85B